MTCKGKVSSIESMGVRVAFEDKESSVSYPLTVAEHVANLREGDNVAVLFFTPGMADGLIIAKF